MYPQQLPLLNTDPFWISIDSHKPRRGTYGKSFNPERHHPQAPNLPAPALIPGLSTSLILTVLIPLMIGVETVERIMRSMEAALGKKR
jgi:hypothetical protein